MLCYFNYEFTYSQYKEYPDWFLNPRKYKNLIVGIESDGKSALENASLYYTAYNRCIVKGDLYFISDEDDFKRQSDYFYETSTVDYKKNLKMLETVDCFINSLINSKKICAFTLNKIELSVLKYKNVGDIKKPSWVDKVDSFDDNDYYFGVGEYTSQGDENEAWLTAEEKSVFSIIKMKQIKITTLKYLEKNEEDEYLVSASKLKLKHSMKDIEILERYPDFENKIFYVLSRIKKNNIKVLLK